MRSHERARGRKCQRFEILDHLGTGGTGAVFRAYDPQLERDVAVKLLGAARDFDRARFAHDKTLLLHDVNVDELMREARMMARLSHPNVLPVYEVIRVENGLVVVMEHVDGWDLRRWLGAPRPTDEILNTFLKAGRGLAAAHASGIVHRDFKPENVLVGRDGRVHITDFGLSRLAPRSNLSRRRLEPAEGTPRYMALELWRGEPATPRADVYAFCVALAEAFKTERGPSLDRALRVCQVPAPVRRMIAAGLSDDPAVRPDLEMILDAIDARWATIVRRSLIGGGLLAIVLGIAAAVATTPAPAAACDANAAQVRTP